MLKRLSLIALTSIIAILLFGHINTSIGREIIFLKKDLWFHKEVLIRAEDALFLSVCIETLPLIRLQLAFVRME